MSRLFTMNFGPVSVFTISACLPDWHGVYFYLYKRKVVR